MTAAVHSINVNFFRKAFLFVPKNYLFSALSALLLLFSRHAVSCFTVDLFVGSDARLFATYTLCIQDFLEFRIWAIQILDIGYNQLYKYN